ncbi:MAG TPA: CHASE3 domain-containing protein, partial [Mucilaginibacter sp.]
MLKFSFRQVLTGFIVSLLLVFTVFYFSYTSINNLQENEKAVARTLAVIKTSIVVQALLLDCETGQQGYIATGKYKFLEPYNRSISLIPASLTDLKALIRDNPVQLQNLDSLTFFADLKSRDVESIVKIARVKGFDTARKVLSGSAGIYD